MRSRILLLPEFRDLSEFQDVLARAAFHLGHVEPEALTFVVSPDLRSRAEQALRSFELPADFDPVIGAMVPLLADRIELVDHGSAAADRVGHLADILVVWSSGRFSDSAWRDERQRRTPFVTIFDVDRHEVRLEGSHWAMLAHKLDEPSIATQATRFEKMLGAIGRARDVFVFGSGPSIQEAKDQDFSNGIRIVCNTVILDHDLMDQLEPQLVTFADPIFHFGPSVYGSRFRAALRRTLADHREMWAVIPIRYLSLMVAIMPEHAGRIVGIPFLPGDGDLVLNLRERFAVKPYPNILTLFMLPLAATIGSRIGLVGFDGRQPGEDYFWKHGSTVQLHDDLPPIQRIHPAFFNLDYEDYYDAHVGTVEKVFRACEARGITVEGRSHSYVPGLKSRLNISRYDTPEWSTPQSMQTHDGTVIVSVDPDWVDAFGHYGPWFEALAKECATREVPAVSLASRGVYGHHREEVLPTFSYPTSTSMAANMYARQFEVELRAAVTHLLEEAPKTNLVLAFYSADVWHIPAIIRVCLAYPTRVRAVVNLMRSHGQITGAAAGIGAIPDSWSYAVGELIKLGIQTGVTVTVDSEELAQILGDISGARAEVLPMATASVVRPGSSNGPPEKVVFYCPALSQGAKGVVEFARAATKMLSGDWSGRVEFRMRSVEQPGGTAQQVTAAIRKAQAAGVKVITGILSDAEYATAMEEAHVVVIPYRVADFRTRTSAVVVDAMRAGKPVIVASGTWSARLVDSAGSGVLFRSGDADDLARAIGEAANRHAALDRRALESADAISKRFSMDALATFFLSVSEGDARSDTELAQTRLDDLEAVLASYLDGRHKGYDTRRGWAAQLHKTASKREMEIEALVARGEQLGRAVEDRDVRYERLTNSYDSLTESRQVLEGEFLSLENDHKALAAEHESALRCTADLEASIVALERGVGNRIFSALKRRLAR